MKRCNIYLVNHMISVNAGENAITQKAMFNIYIDENFYIEERFRFNGKSVISNSSTNQ